MNTIQTFLDQIRSSFDTKAASSCIAIVNVAQQELLFTTLHVGEKHFSPVVNCTWNWKKLDSKAIDDAFQELKLNSFGFRDIIISINSTFFSCVPKSISDQVEERVISAFTQGITDYNEHLAISNELNALDANIVFGSEAEKDLLHALKHYKPVHEISGWLSEVALLSRQKKETHFHILFAHTGQFYLAGFEGERLVFCNQFQAETPEDLAYYTLYTAQQLQINPVETAVTWYGKTDIFEKTALILNTYFKSLEEVKQHANERLQFAIGKHAHLQALVLCVYSVEAIKAGAYPLRNHFQ